MNEKSLEIIRLFLYFLVIISSFFIGYYANQIHNNNKLIEKNEELIRAYIKLKDYEKASYICSQTQDYIKFIASFNPAFFDIKIDVNELNEVCNEVYFYNLNLLNSTIVLPR